MNICYLDRFTFRYEDWKQERDTQYALNCGTIGIDFYSLEHEEVLLPSNKSLAEYSKIFKIIHAKHIPKGAMTYDQFFNIFSDNDN